MRIIRQWTGSEWVTVVNHPWDVDKCPAWDPHEVQVLGDIRSFDGSS